MALDQHGALLKMVIVVLGSHSHFTGRPCWFWLSWFMCLSARLWEAPRLGKLHRAAHGREPMRDRKVQDVSLMRRAEGTPRDEQGVGTQPEHGGKLVVELVRGGLVYSLIGHRIGYSPLQEVSSCLHKRLP